MRNLKDKIKKAKEKAMKLQDKADAAWKELEDLQMEAKEQEK